MGRLLRSIQTKHFPDIYAGTSYVMPRHTQANIAFRGFRCASFPVAFFQGDTEAIIFHPYGIRTVFCEKSVWIGKGQLTPVKKCRFLYEYPRPFQDQQKYFVQRLEEERLPWEFGDVTFYALPWGDRKIPKEIFIYMRRQSWHFWNQNHIFYFEGENPPDSFVQKTTYVNIPYTLFCTEDTEKLAEGESGPPICTIPERFGGNGYDAPEKFIDQLLCRLAENALKKRKRFHVF
jgi:hypothetical protein